MFGLTSEEGLIRGAGPIGLGLPQRGLWETGKSPIHHGKTSPCQLWFAFLLYFVQFTFIELNCLYALYECLLDISLYVLD